MNLFSDTTFGKILQHTREIHVIGLSILLSCIKKKVSCLYIVDVGLQDTLWSLS